MASPNYFKNFQKVQYAIKANRSGNIEYMDIVDYFHLSTIREDVFAEDTLYTPYVVQNNETPSQVSYKQYGDEQFYWVILQINGITDYYNEWPLSQGELEEYIYRKYGGVLGGGATHHWETPEVLDADGNLLLNEGLVVPEDFVFYYPAEVDGEKTTLSAFPSSVSNSTYERRLNEEKQHIQILDPQYVYRYNREAKYNSRNAKPSKSEINISESFNY